MENASKALIIAGAILISILLISIGIILINSGRDITETGTSGMQSQKIQTFNAQFTAFEGAKKGAELRTLADVVNASNATDAEHQVGLAIYSSSGKTYNSLADLNNSRTYNVEIRYADAATEGFPADRTNVSEIVEPEFSSEKGYIYLIVIND